ncbi:MAG: hypothetical protein Q9218_003215 [Villophora microphyllina]
MSVVLPATLPATPVSRHLLGSAATTPNGSESIVGKSELGVPVSRKLIARQISLFLKQAASGGKLETEYNRWATTLLELTRVYREAAGDGEHDPGSTVVAGSSSRVSNTSRSVSNPDRGNVPVRFKRPRATTTTMDSPTYAKGDPQSPQTPPSQHSESQIHGKKGNKRRKIEDTFSNRVRAYQEQAGNDIALTATVDRWESVARGVQELRLQELRLETFDQGKGHGRAKRKASTQKRGGGRTVDMSAKTDTVNEQIMYFCRVFGRPGASRLHDLIRRIRSHLEDGRALEHHPPTIQLPLERRQKPLDEWMESVEQHNQTRTEELNAVFKRYISGARQYQNYEKTLRDAEITGSDTEKDMRAKGLTTSQGRGVATLVKAYYLHMRQGFDIEQASAKEEDITDGDLRRARNRLQNQIAMGKTYFVLQEAFTPGVFALLPEQVPNCFRSSMWPGTSLAEVTHRIASSIPETVILCRNILELILNPLVEGRGIRSLKMETSKRSRLSLLQLVAPAEIELTASADVESIESGDQQRIQETEENVDVAAQRLLDLVPPDDDITSPASESRPSDRDNVDVPRGKSIGEESFNSSAIFRSMV